MKGLKEVKYTDQWFRAQADEMRIEPGSRINEMMMERIGYQRKARSFAIWIKSSAAAVCLIGASYFFFQTQDSRSGELAQLTDLTTAAQNSYYNDYSGFLMSKEYRSLLNSYELLENQ